MLPYITPGVDCYWVGAVPKQSIVKSVTLLGNAWRPVCFSTKSGTSSFGKICDFRCGLGTSDSAACDFGCRAWDVMFVGLIRLSVLVL